MLPSSEAFLISKALVFVVNLQKEDKMLSGFVSLNKLIHMVCKSKCDQTVQDYMSTSPIC